MNLAGFVESIIPFVRPPHLKLQLNEQFALKHPEIPRGLTLSKIRAIKRELLSFAQEQARGGAPSSGSSFATPSTPRLP